MYSYIGGRDGVGRGENEQHTESCTYMIDTTYLVLHNVDLCLHHSRAQNTAIVRTNTNTISCVLVET